MTSKEMRQARAKLVEYARAIVNKAGATAEDLANADRMMDEADAMKAGIDRLERSESLFVALGSEIQNRSTDTARVLVTDRARDTAILARIVAGQGNALSDADKEYCADVVARDKRILTAMATGGLHRLTAEDQAHHASHYGVIRAAGNESTNSAGGYTVAPLFEAELLIALKAFGGMRGVARTVQTDTGATLPWPTMDDTGNVATIIGTENTQLTADTDLAFGQASIGAYTYKAGPLPVSLQLLQDSVFDFGSLVQTAMTMRFARGQNTHFTVGTGSGQPSGVVLGAASGTVGATGQTTTVTWQDFVKLEHSVDPAYRQGSIFMFHDTTLRAIKQLVDGYNRPLWLPGIAVGAPDTFLGYHYQINQDMPVMAANAKSILFGDFKNYIIRDTLGLQMMVLRERFADYLQVAWIGYMRSDGKLISAAQPIKYYANSAT